MMHMMDMRDVRARCDGHAGPPYPTFLVTVLIPPASAMAGPGSLVLCASCLAEHYRKRTKRTP